MQRRKRLITVLCLCGLVLAGAIGWMGLREGGMRGEYAQVDGPGRLEFRGKRVYITTALGLRFASPYEVDGHHIIIKGAAGSQVYTREGETLDGGLGIRYVKVESEGSLGP
jgi:hypothetical protein